MRNLGRTVAVAALVLLSASWAWSAVTISWTDAAGPHSQSLQLIDNPNYRSDSWPACLEDPYVWFGICNVSMSEVVMPVQFNVAGNFLGDFGLLWAQVRIEQHVTNLTSQIWDRFDIDIVDDDGEVYVNAMSEPNWSVTTDLLYARFTADAPEYRIWPLQVFDDIQHFWAIVPDPELGDGTLTFSKQASGPVVPEAGSVAGLLSGAAALIVSSRRRKRE